MSETTKETAREPRSLDGLVRCCGPCKFFDSEDISGGGWCTVADKATTCGDRCSGYHDDFYTPNASGEPEKMRR